MTGASRAMTHLTRRGFAAGAVLALSGCATAERRFRERLTLYVETPEGTVSGSGVVQATIGFQDGLASDMFGVHSLLSGTRGEATIVDLGARGVLFALLIPDETRKRSGGPGGYEWVVFPALDAQAKRDSGGNNNKQIALFIDALNRFKPKGELPIDSLSLLVRFRDPHDPRTVERVDPDDLAASFGAGVRLAHATIKIVDEPLTTGIETRLPWLVGGHGETQLFPENNGRSIVSIQPIELLTHYDFWRSIQ